jgi:glycosyltransferase involved in cell wall biosynthesis
MTRPRVVHVYKDFWPPILGGVERCINWMVGGLRDSFEFTILVNSRQGRTVEREWEGVRIIEVGEWGRALSAPLSPAFPFWMRRLKADIWHFHLPNPTGDVSWLLSRPKGKVVATYHSDIVRQAWAMRLYGPFLNVFLRRCDVIMPTSPRQLEFSPVLQAHRAKCQPLPLGIPMEGLERTAELGLKSREIKKAHKGFPLVSFVGRLRYYKGLHFMISALQGLPSVHFLIIGEGPEKERLTRLAEQLGVADRVYFLGELGDDDVVTHLAASDLFVLPSHLAGEQFGLSMVEAMALGVPAICCDLPTGVPFVNQDGVTGRVVEAGSGVALAGAIEELLSDPNRRFQMGEAAHRRARQEFSREAMCQRLGSVYTSLLD